MLKKTLYRALALSINAVSYVSADRAGALAFRLFGTPPPPRIRRKEADFLDTANREDIEHNGRKIPVYRWGPPAGPVVLCAYGWGYNAGRWRHFVPRLVEAGYRVVAFDPPGHGRASGNLMEYPTMVAIERKLLERYGPVELVLGHSFGGGCMVEALATSPPELRPRRLCLMATFSEVRWLFAGFVDFLGLREAVYRGMERWIIDFSGRNLDEFDAALHASQLADTPTLIVHDPQDPVTAFRNARRNHSHWQNAWLYAPEGAGHHLGTAEVTNTVLDWLILGEVPAAALRNNGQLRPMPAELDRSAMDNRGVTDFYG